MEFNWPLGFSELFPKNVPARFTSLFVDYHLSLAAPIRSLSLSCFCRAYVSLSLFPSPFFLFSSFDLRALSTNIPCQSIPSEISNGIVPSDDITRRFCIFHRTLTIRTAMKLSSTDRYTRADTQKKLAGTWPRSELTFRVFAEYSLVTRSLRAHRHCFRSAPRAFAIHSCSELLLLNAHVNGNGRAPIRLD